MLHSVFAVFDQKAEAYLPPFILPKVAQAQRIFGDCVNSNSHEFGKNPDDYTLFTLGTWDDNTGVFMPYPAHESLGNGVEYVRQEDMFTKAMEGLQDAETRTEHREQSLENDAPILPGAKSRNTEE